MRAHTSVLRQIDQNALNYKIIYVRTTSYPDRERAACMLAGSGRFSMAGLPGRLGTLSSSRSAHLANLDAFQR